MNRNNQDELITDIYRAKLVYEAEMKSAEYQAKGEEDFEFIGKALAAKGYCKAEDVAREIFEEIEKYNRSPIPECEPVYVLRKRELCELMKKFDCEV